jgi:molybdopterin-containing oxidoreductase family iron-sulfur binding subunit
MVIDLKKCVGCNACTVACKSEHNTPGGILFTSVLDKEMGKFPDVIRVFVPILCNHCEQPSCADVCPSKATYRREDGIVMIDYDLCMGCAACVEHCPYHARDLVGDPRTVLMHEGRERVFERPVHRRIPERVAAKCDFCFFRVERGEEPACAALCPTGARIFGDLNDPNSAASMVIRELSGWTLLPEKGTEPRVYYVGQ